MGIIPGHGEPLAKPGSSLSWVLLLASVLKQQVPGRRAGDQALHWVNLIIFKRGQSEISAWSLAQEDLGRQGRKRWAARDPGTVGRRTEAPCILAFMWYIIISLARWLRYWASFTFL